MVYCSINHDLTYRPEEVVLLNDPVVKYTACFYSNTNFLLGNTDKLGTKLRSNISQ